MSTYGPTTIKVVHGLEETRKAMKGLQRSVRRNILRRATRAGCVVMQRDARARAPKRTGALKKAIAVRADNKPYGVKGMVYITSTVKVRKHATIAGKFVRAKQKGFAGTIYPRAYAHLVEFGTQPHYLGKGSERASQRLTNEHGLRVRVGPGRNEHGRKHPGARPKPYMRPAYDTKKEEAQKVFGQVLMREVEKEIALQRAKRRTPAGAAR